MKKITEIACKILCRSRVMSGNFLAPVITQEINLMLDKVDESFHVIILYLSRINITITNDKPFNTAMLIKYIGVLRKELEEYLKIDAVKRKVLVELEMSDSDERYISRSLYQNKITYLEYMNFLIQDAKFKPIFSKRRIFLI